MKKTAVNVLIFILCMGISMTLCAYAGYFLAKKKAPQNSGAASHHNSGEGIYSPLARSQSLREAFSASSDVPAQSKDDYLVIKEKNLVNLYIINSDGTKIFRRILDIHTDSLTENDRALLSRGIILDTEEELLSLLEDYTS